MKISRVLGAPVMAAGLLLLLAGSSFAHHSFALEFDGNKCRDFIGTLTRLDWQNPHSHFSVDVKNAGGKVESWLFEGLSTLSMRRAGTERQDFIDNIGKEVWIRGCLARSGTENKAAAEQIKFPDGRVRQAGAIVEEALNNRNIQ